MLDADLLLIITNTADEHSRGTNINYLEQPSTLKNMGSWWIIHDFGCTFRTAVLNFNVKGHFFVTKVINCFRQTRSKLWLITSFLLVNCLIHFRDIRDQSPELFEIECTVDNS